MVKIDKSKHKVYYDRAIDCFNALSALQVLYYDEQVKPDYLLEYRIKHFDVLFILYSISVISLINCLTVKEFGEKGKDHNDMSFFKQLKAVYPKISRFEGLALNINRIKNSSEYGDKHYTPNKEVDINTLKKFLEFVEDKI